VTLDVRFASTLGTFHIEAGFRSESGETTVLLGESGSGKTTVLRFLAGLLDADDGHLVLDDELYVDTDAHFSVPAQERPIGYVFQDYILFPHLSVRDNVGFGLRMQGTSKAVITERVNEALRQVHLIGYDDRHPKELSGGQQQRVAIARALALRPQLLLLDESLSALDIQTRHEVEIELHAILRELKLTTVMVSHQYSDALNFADHIIVLENGSVIQRGAHADLLRHPHSSYIAEMVGVNRLPCRVDSAAPPAAACRVSLLAEDGPAVEIDAVAADTVGKGDDGKVVLHPRRISLHARAPGGAVNVVPCEILQAAPVSAELAPGGGMRGLMRVILVPESGVPPLRAEVAVDGSGHPRLEEGAKVYASFAAEDAHVFRGR
jgi:molybdate transport system ATP-binding protein